ncbi:MAG: helix-turn-helix domain-containing protein [Clostridia bacterium]|nr:helix-turn-helix domain-containing protein [Clostridia bacterium]
MDFSEKSKYLRKEKGLSQVQLAQALNVSKACISMIEIGKNEPTANTLIRYANFFECSTDYLLGREDDFGNIIINGEYENILSSEEYELIKFYRKLPTDLRSRANSYMEKLSNIIDTEKQDF